MRVIYSNYTASITELKKSPTSLLKESGDKPIAILNHNKPTAYLVPSHIFEKMVDIVDDYLLSEKIKERVSENAEPIEVSLDEL